MFIPIQANLEQYTDKGAESVISFLINDWKGFRPTDFYNLITKHLSRGSLYHIKTFGKLSRFCLNFGIDIVFIPFKEPWRNGYIENFNKRFNELLWQSKRFKRSERAEVESKKFEINITTIRNIKKIISLSNIAKAIHEDYYQKASPSTHQRITNNKRENTFCPV
ncbi:MAG: transposase [Candidatus Scalindua sp.]|nr:transposase [Candidatus Scalindua sp.]